MPWMKEIEGSWGDEANALVPSVQMILFCQVDGTRKQYSFISPRSAFHRGNSIEKKKGLYQPWNILDEMKHWRILPPSLSLIWCFSQFMKPLFKGHHHLICGKLHREASSLVCSHSFSISAHKRVWSGWLKNQGWSVCTSRYAHGKEGIEREREIHGCI